MSVSHETLFSLELAVECVSFDGARDDDDDDDVDPAVGVRFLDFPTLLISRSGKVQDKDSLQYSFHKGKSCLFKINLDSLHEHLSNAPLYIMVLDVKGEIPKLLGSSLISLAKATERLRLDVARHGISTPAAYGERVVTQLCNLMGHRIGSVSLAYKIVSLGANLIPHIPDSRVYKVGEVHREGERNPKASAEDAEVLHNEKDKKKSSPAENHPGNVPSKQDRPDGRPSSVPLSETKQPAVATVFTQTEHAKQRVTWSELAYGDDKQENSIFCPPPLFYSSSVKDQQESAAERCRMLNVDMESLNIEDPEDEYNEAGSAAVGSISEKIATQADRRSKIASSSRTQHKNTDPPPFGDGIRQLPLLNALFFELSQLNGHTQQLPLTAYADLAWQNTSAHGPSAPEIKPENSNTEKKLQRGSQSHSPKQRMGQSKMKGYIKSPISPSVKRANGAKRSREKSPPKRKLKCGLTNTFRLRLQQVKPGVTKRHECMEHHKLKQDKPQRQRSSSPKHAHKSASRMCNRGVKIDENIETLISSFEMDRAALETTSSKSHKRPNAKEHLTKHAPSSKNTLKEKAVPTASDKKLRVHIPSALSHYSDQSGQRSSSFGQDVHPSVTNPGFQISSEDDSSPTHRTNLSSESIEQEEYQDDFTSLDPTDGYSPDPFSSPEPHRHGRNRDSSENSNSDSGSHGNKALPVPVKAETSPKRSLKATHIIRARLHTSALSLSSDDCEDEAVSESSRSSRHQQRSGSHSSGPESVLRTSGRSESVDIDPADEGMSADSVFPANDSVLESLSSPDRKEAEDHLGSLGLDKNYHHISELVMNKLPGYTL